MKKNGTVAVIGAGISGLGCARALRDAGVDVRVFERGPSVGGRCATRLWQGHLVDYGVQYFTADSPLFKKELLTRLRQFRPLVPPILDAAGQLVPSESGPRFYVLQGNSYLAHALSTGIDVRLNTSVSTTSLQSDGIECLGEVYSAVVSSLPGPQTARLFDLPRTPAEYESCFTAMLEYPESGLGEACYARQAPVDSPLLMSYCENHKAGRIVGNKTVFIVEATPSFSRELASAPPEDLLEVLARENDALWGLSTACTARSLFRWDYAWPLADSRQRVDLPKGAFLCGDSQSGNSVEDVWLSGQTVAQEVLAYLTEIAA